jgi:hypothetical protein
VTDTHGVLVNGGIPLNAVFDADRWYHVAITAEPSERGN